MKLGARTILGAAVLLSVLTVPVCLLGTTAGASWMLSLLESRAPIHSRELDGSLWSGLSIGTFNYVDDDLVLSGENLQLNLDWSCVLRVKLCIETLRAEVVSLQVTKRDEPGKSADALSPWPEAPLAWSLPLSVDAFEVQHFEFRQGERLTRVEDVAAALSIGAEEAELRTFRARLERGEVQGSAQLSRLGKWRLDMQAAAPGPWLDAPSLELPERLLLNASGDLQSFKARVYPPDEDAETLELTVQGTLEARDSAFTLLFSLQGLSRLLPQLASSPWTQLEGPLAVTLYGGEAGLRLQFAQQLRNYAQQASWLRGELIEEKGVWHLPMAALGDAQAPLLSLAGELGSIEDLHPQLHLSFTNFLPPEQALEPIESLNGQLFVDFPADGAVQGWSLTSSALALQTTQGDWVFEGSLTAADPLLLPLGHWSMQSGDTQLAYRRESPLASAFLTVSEGIELGSLTLPALQAQVTPGERTVLSLAVAGELTASIESTLWRDSTGISFAVQPFTAQRENQTLALRDTLHGHWRQDQRVIDIEAFCIVWRRSEACAQPSTLGESGELYAKLRLDEDVEQAHEAAHYRLQAVAEGSLAFHWTQGELRAGELELDFQQLSLNPLAGQDRSLLFTWETAELSANMRPDTGLSLSAELHSTQAGVLQLQLQERERVLGGELTLADFDLQALDKVLPEARLLAGRANAELSISGSRDEPQLLGVLRLSEGAMHLDSLDATFTDLHLELSAEGQNFEIEGAALLGGGPIRLDGQCCAESALSLQVTGEHNVLNLPQGLQADVSPHLNFILGPSQLSLDGELRVHDGVLEHSGPRGGGVALSEDIQRVDSDVSQTRRFAIDARVSALVEPGFTLRSEQLEATVSGDLRLDARAGEPLQLFGNLQVLGGELRAYGQALRLTEGSAGFVGNPTNPQLNLSAERRIRGQDLRVGFRVGGSLDEPQFELFSDPQMSEKETLSYLLRGRGPDAGASMDGTALALSLGTSALNRSGVMESLNRIPGLSGVTLGAEGSEEDMAATLSAYVGERLYLSYGVGIYEPVNALTARLYLRSRLWLEVVSRLESSFDLYYRFDRE